MALKVRVTALTSTWKQRQAELERSLSELDAVCPGDEDMELTVSERPEDPWIHVTILRARRTWLWSDAWSMAPGDQPSTFRYEKAFERQAPSIADIVESIRRMLQAPYESSP